MENSNQWIEEILRKIGKKSFVCHLYPELKNNMEVTIEDIALRHPEFKKYTLDSQRTRLSKARAIFREGKEKEALLNCVYSAQMDKESLKKAQDFLQKLF